jgi:hypothetical protein
MSTGGWLQSRPPLKVLGIVCLLTCGCTRYGQRASGSGRGSADQPEPGGSD